jgi:hypothetical protein
MSCYCCPTQIQFILYSDFVRASGDGWWSVERKKASADGHDFEEPFADFEVLRNPKFLVICFILIAAQILAVGYLYYSGKARKTFDNELSKKSERHKKKDK